MITSADGLIEALGGTEPIKNPQQSMIRTRFPYTYAYDWLRECVGCEYSRSNMARLSRHWEPNEDRHWKMCAELALRYMDYWNIVAD